MEKIEKKINQKGCRVRRSTHRRAAFTLVEVLITLSILGVVAGITIPSIVQRTTEKADVVKLKKTYAILSNALEIGVLENGSVDSWFVENPINYSATNMFNILKRYLKVTKTGYATDGKIFAPLSEYKNIVGGDTFLSMNPTSFYYDPVGLLPDGTAIWVHAHTKEKCLNGEYCFLVYVDVNGTKGPNRYGIDYFRTIVYKGTGSRADYIEPGCNKNMCVSIHLTKESSAPQAGDYCACWVINKGNMDYRRRDVKGEWNF